MPSKITCIMFPVTSSYDLARRKENHDDGLERPYVIKRPGASFTDID